MTERDDHRQRTKQATDGGVPSHCVRVEYHAAVGHVIGRGPAGFHDRSDKPVGLYPTASEAAAVLVRS